MADRNKKPVTAVPNKLVILPGSFAPNGSSAVNNASNAGTGFTVARSGVGTFVITLTDRYVRLRSHSVKVQLATPADTQVQLTAEAVSAATPTITVTVLTAGVAADIAAAAGNRIHFTLFLSEDTVQA